MKMQQQSWNSTAESLIFVWIEQKIGVFTTFLFLFFIHVLNHPNLQRNSSIHTWARAIDQNCRYFLQPFPWILIFGQWIVKLSCNLLFNFRFLEFGTFQHLNIIQMKSKYKSKELLSWDLIEYYTNNNEEFKY